MNDKVAPKLLVHLMAGKPTSDWLGGVRVLIQWHRQSVRYLTQEGSQ